MVTPPPPVLPPTPEGAVMIMNYSCALLMFIHAFFSNLEDLGCSYVKIRIWAGGEELRAGARRRRGSPEALRGGDGAERGAPQGLGGGDGRGAARGVDAAVRAEEDWEVVRPHALLRPRQQAARLLQEAAQGQHGASEGASNRWKLQSGRQRA